MGLGVNSGGLSKGGPIWPGAKPGQAKQLDPAKEAFEIHKEVSAPDVKSTGKAGLESQVSKTAPVQQQTPVQISKSMSPKDILQQLAKINIPINDSNKEIALLMATHGVEISEDSFGLVNKLLKGKKSASAKESAVLLVSKGLGNAVDDVSILDGLLSKNATINQALKDLEGMQQKMGKMLQNMTKNFPALSGFLSTFDDFNDELKKMRKLDPSNRWLSEPMDIMDDLSAMKGFLQGLANKGLLKGRTMKNYLNALAKLNENFLAQMIASQNSIKQPIGLLESFHYTQVPNPLAAQAAIEILLRKHVNQNAKKSKKDADKEQEKIIISLDTESMGKITIIVVVMGFKVWCNVHSDKEDAITHINSFRKEFADNLQQMEFKLEEFKTSRKLINIHKFIAPTQDLSEVKRIETEI
ncbi:MAG: hypothetical protein ACON35_06785 [Candidatus Marinamargulisbacteria bacterium]